MMGSWIAWAVIGFVYVFIGALVVRAFSLDWQFPLWQRLVCILLWPLLFFVGFLAGMIKVIIDAIGGFTDG